MFDILAATGITTVTVDFDGYGDDGQIQNITAKAGDSPVELPTTPVGMRGYEVVGCADHFEMIEKVTQQPLSEAIEELCYDYLGKHYAGWDDNDGSFGKFKFNVTARTISLEFNYRHVSTEVNEF